MGDWIDDEVSANRAIVIDHLRAENAKLREENTDLESVVERMRGLAAGLQLERDNARAALATALARAEEAEGDVVWAVRRSSHLELSKLQSGVDLVSHNAHRIPVNENDDDGEFVYYEEAASEIATLRGAAEADEKRLRDAAECAGIAWFGCDTPEVLADTIGELRARVEQLEERVPASLLCAWNGAGDPNPGSWHYWATEYPDEGAIGPFDSMAKAVAHGENAGHTFTDWFIKEIDRVRALWKGSDRAAIDAARKGGS